jgi:hypothetical protein
MQSYYIKPSLVKLLSLNPTLKYTLAQIKTKISEITLTSNLLKNVYPNFNGCKCVSTHCKVNAEKLYEYIVNYEIIDDGIPDCSFYFTFNETPQKIDSSSFTVI